MTTSPRLGDSFLVNELQRELCPDVQTVADHLTAAALADGLQALNEVSNSSAAMLSRSQQHSLPAGVDLEHAERLLVSIDSDSIAGSHNRNTVQCTGSVGSGHAGTSLLSPELEPDPLLRGKSAASELSPDEIGEYMERHHLQAFIAHMVSYVARHLPVEPLEFLVEQMGAIVQQYHAKRGRRLPSLTSEDTSPFPLAPPQDPPMVMNAEQQERVVKNLSTVLRSPSITRAAATKIFKQFAGSDAQLSRGSFGKLLRHLGATWGLREDDSKLIVEVLKRWRFRSNAANGKRGLPLWPLAFDDFVSSYPSLLRAVRDRYMPIGANVNRSLFIRQAAGQLSERYEVGPNIGRGAYGEVKLVTLHSNQERRVCKRVRHRQQRVPTEELVDEVGLLRRLDHPHIIRIFEYFVTDEHIDMIMEPVFGGTLGKLAYDLYYDSEGYFKAERPAALTETWVAMMMAQLLGALTYAHDVVGLIHKDLKSDNVLLVGRPNLAPEEVLQQPVHAMLADFGIAEVFAPDPVLPRDGRSSFELRHQSSRVGGTPSYMSPEMFKGSFTEKCDIWSLGVIMFQMTTGGLPYKGSTILSQVHLVTNPRKHPEWEMLAKYRWSLGARLFCQKLLSKDEDMRPTAAEASQDNWLVKEISHNADEMPSAAERAALLSQHLQSHLLKMARHCITSQLSLSPLHHLNARFRQYDRDGNGRLSYLEMRQVLEDVGITDAQDMELIIESLDCNRNGLIEYSEFVAGCLDLASDDMRKQLRAVFDVFDLDGSGAISVDELRQVLTQGANPTAEHITPDGSIPLGTCGFASVLPDGKTVEEVMLALDTNGTGQVEFEEFEQYLLAEHEDYARRVHSGDCSPSAKSCLLPSGLPSARSAVAMPSERSIDSCN